MHKSERGAGRVRLVHYMRVSWDDMPLLLMSIADIQKLRQAGVGFSYAWGRRDRAAPACPGAPSQDETAKGE